MVEAVKVELAQNNTDASTSPNTPYDLEGKIDYTGGEPSQILFSSVLKSLTDLGFELEFDQRISFFKNSLKMYVFMGKVEDCYDKKIDMKDCLDENLTL